MARLVMKFGGTSVADLNRIRHVANLVANEAQHGHEIAVVVSAMSGETNRLISYVDELASDNGSDLDLSDEYDTIVASGEQVTSGLLSIALRKIGIEARSWQGWQIPLRTDNAHSVARIKNIETTRFNQSLKNGAIGVVAGFQGISPDGRVSTLGRGGSDTSAVALAIALGADRCDIYTDVDGVYTTDPRIVREAKRIEKISFEEMLELASQGAKVLQTRSVELAMNNNMPIRVLSSFAGINDKNPGTIVCAEEKNMEKQIVSGIAYSRDEAQISLLRLRDKPGVVAKVLGVMSDANIVIDMIVQGSSRQEDWANLVFTVTKTDIKKAVSVLQDNKDEIGFGDIVYNDKVSKVSIVGVGMRSHAGVAHKMFKALAERGINIEVIATSEIKISVLIDSDMTELAVRALHSAFGLDK